MTSGAAASFQVARRQFDGTHHRMEEDLAGCRTRTLRIAQTDCQHEPRRKGAAEAHPTYFSRLSRLFGIGRKTDDNFFEEEGYFFLL